MAVLLSLRGRRPPRPSHLLQVSQMISRSYKLVSATLAVVAVSSTAGWHSESVACDQAMIGAWQRTWYGAYALETPLRDYYISRLPGRCDGATSRGCGVFIDSSGITDCAAQLRPSWNQQQPEGWSCHPSVATGFESIQFERLGQIPNDLGTGPAQLAAPPSR